MSDEDGDNPHKHDMNTVLKNWAWNGKRLSSKLCLSHLLAVSGWEDGNQGVFSESQPGRMAIE